MADPGAGKGQHADGQQTHRYVVLAVTIGPTYGAGFRICPNADARDGLLDICTVRYTPLMRALKLLPVVQKGEHTGLPEVAFYTAPSVSIEARQPVAVQMDGETGSASRFDVSIVPGALQVRV